MGDANGFCVVIELVLLCIMLVGDDYEGWK